MTVEQFGDFWYSVYPATVPLSYLLKHAYPERWVRFHSLPNSKRYPEDEAEISVILARQNTLMKDLVGADAPLLLVTGKYVSDTFESAASWFDDDYSLSGFSFTELPAVELDKLDPDPRVLNGYSPGDLYKLAVAEINWQPGKLDSILRDIANGEIRAFFISIPRECIIAPYDGGVDLILKDTDIRDHLKSKYKNWLSSHSSGL